MLILDKLVPLFEHFSVGSSSILSHATFVSFLSLFRNIIKTIVLHFKVIDIVYYYNTNIFKIKFRIFDFETAILFHFKRSFKKFHRLLNNKNWKITIKFVELHSSYYKHKKYSNEKKREKVNEELIIVIKSVSIRVINWKIFIMQKKRFPINPYATLNIIMLLIFKLSNVFTVFPYPVKAINKFIFLCFLSWFDTLLLYPCIDKEDMNNILKLFL